MPCSTGSGATPARADPLDGIEEAMLRALRAGEVPPAARGFADDAAVLSWPLGLDLVATHDMLAQGVHFTPGCPPADVGWKLVAVNYSDLAAMGARPVGVLLGAGIGADRDADWAEAFLQGVRQALAAFGGVLLGGDTIRAPGPSVLSLTALGSVPPGEAPARAGASAGDDLWVSGTIGDAALGLAIAQGTMAFDAALLRRYRRPVPRLSLGIELRGVATAAMDVSDGLLLDAGRLAAASGLAATILVDAVPLGDAARAAGAAAATTAGDDYELLFAAPVTARTAVAAAAAAARTPVARIGTLAAGSGRPRLLDRHGAVVPILRDGYRHR